MTRTGLRIYYFRKISADDFIMFVALGSLTASFVMSCYLRDAIFTQIAMGLGMMLIPTDVIDILRVYLKHMVALSVLTWFTIFTVSSPGMLLPRKMKAGQTALTKSCAGQDLLFSLFLEAHRSLALDDRMVVVRFDFRLGIWR